MQLDLSAFIFNIPLLVLVTYSFIEINNEFKIHNYISSIDSIYNNIYRIRELCYCKSSDPVNPCKDKCPIFQNMSNLKKGRRFRNRKCYPYLSPDDLNHSLNLAVKLRHSPDPVSEYLRENEDLSNLLSDYVGHIRNANVLRTNLYNRSPKGFENLTLNARRSIVNALFGDWYHPIKSSKAERYAYPAALLDRIDYDLCIKLNKVIYGPCIYDPVRFAGVTLRDDTQAHLTNYFRRGLASVVNFKPVQLNRLLLRDAYPGLIAEGSYTNHLWNIIKDRYILTDKQAQYFELISVQLFLIAVSSFNSEIDLSWVLILFTCIFVLPAIYKDKPFDWFKNRYYRFCAATLAWLFAYNYYVWKIT